MALGAIVPLALLALALVDSLGSHRAPSAAPRPAPAPAPDPLAGYGVSRQVPIPTPPTFTPTSAATPDPQAAALYQLAALQQAQQAQAAQQAALAALQHAPPAAPQTPQQTAAAGLVQYLTTTTHPDAAAIRQYQTAMGGIQVDGILGDETRGRALQLLTQRTA